SECSRVLRSCCFMRPCPTRPTLFPYTTLFRSRLQCVVVEGEFVVGVQPGDQAQAQAFAVDLGLGAVGGVAAPASLVALHHVQARSEEHTSELQSRENLVCRLLLEKENILRRGM